MNMMRFAEKRDFPAVRALWETCFPDEGGFNDWFFAHCYKEEHTLLCLEDETLVAMVQMLPYRMTAGGVSREVTYIYGACTDPAHRRKGHMARLLERSFELDREAGRMASVLIPAEEWLFDFYRPFGYEPFFPVKRREITRAAGESEAPRRLTAGDVPKSHKNLGKAVEDASLTFRKFTAGEIIPEPPSPFRKLGQSVGVVRKTIS